MAIKDFDEAQVLAAHLALSIVGGVSSFNANGTYTSNTLNTHHDGGAYIEPIDEVWVVDDNDNRVYRYETDGTSAGTFNVDSSNTTPKGVAYIASIDEVWIVENDQFHRYETDRSYIGALSTGFSSQSITGIAYDSVRDRVIMVNDTSNRLYTYDTAGSVTGNTSGNALNSSNSDPSDVMYYRSLDEIWVLDRVDNTIYKYAGEDMSYIGTESLDSANTDSRMLVYIDSIEEIWAGQNNSTTFYRYELEVVIDRGKLVSAIESFSSSQRSDTRAALNVPNLITAENSDVSYTNDHTIVVDGDDAQVNDILVFQYRQNLTRTDDEVTIQLGNNTAGRVRILDSDLSLRWMTLNDITRYALYMVMRVDGDIWQYIGGTRNEVTPAFKVSDISTESSSVADDDRLAISDQSVSDDPNRYIEAEDLRTYMLRFHALTNLSSIADSDRMVITDDSNAADLPRSVSVEDLSEHFNDIHERIDTELTELEDDDRIPVSDESESGEPTKYVKMENVADFVGNSDAVSGGGDVEAGTWTASLSGIGTFSTLNLTVTGGRILRKQPAIY